MSEAPKPSDTPRRRPDREMRRLLLLASVFVVSACGLGYELVAGAVSSYLVGDAVTQFSIVIGVFLSAMGVGAYFSQHIRRDLLGAFVDLEIGVGLVGGVSSILVFAASVYLEESFEVVFYGLCVLIGAMVGAEVPLLVRLLQQDGRDLREALGQTLALDYIGALAGSLTVPLLALPYLGLSRVSIVFGMMNLVAAFFGMRLLGGSQRRRGIRLGLASAILLAALFVSPQLVGLLEDHLYDDAIIYAESTPYQRVILTRHRDDVRLYLNGHIQFSSVDEARYHEPLVMPAMEAANRPRRVLVLGGGDGLAVREVLRYPSVTSVTLVDLDPTVTRLASERRELLALNERSLLDPRVEIVAADALTYVRESREFYDVIIADLPDPNSSTLAKLYSRQFYTSALRRLSARGVFVTHATSPFFAREAYWSIVATLEAASERAPVARQVGAYHAHVPSFGEWGFAIAAPAEVELVAREPSVETRFLNPGAWRAMFAFGSDLRRPAEVVTNELFAPTLHDAYHRGWATY